MNEFRKWLHSDEPENRFTRVLLLNMVIATVIALPIMVVPVVAEVRATLTPMERSNPGIGLLIIVIAGQAIANGMIAGLLLTIVYFLVAPYIRRLFRKSARR